MSKQSKEDDMDADIDEFDIIDDEDDGDGFLENIKADMSGSWRRVESMLEQRRIRQQLQDLEDYALE
jgi:hypothetical protein